MTITRELGRKELRLNQIAVVIPSYEPGQELITLLDELLFTWGLSAIGFNSTLAKIIVDSILYLTSYKLQQIWVFS